MAGLYVKDDDTWYLPKSIWVKSGTWRVCSNVYVKSGGTWKELIKTVDITSSKSNFNLYEYLGSPSEPLSVVVNISSSVEIFSSDTSGNRTPAFTVGNFPTNSTVIINNNGYISGGGGFGGKGTWYGYDSGSNGTKGGDGIVKGSSNNFDISIVNTGTIAGGGGGGGGAGSYYVYTETILGGQQGGYTRGGHGGDGAGIEGYSRTQGGNSASNQNKYDRGIDGGQGGAIGENGQDGQASGRQQKPNGKGGQAGKAIIRSGMTIAVSGNIDGGIG